jgi:hypothetical protein
MSKQQSRKLSQDVNKLGASEATQPPRKDEQQPRGRKPRTRSGRAATATASAAAADLPKASAENSALSITNDEPPEKTALQPKPRSKGANTAPVSVSSPDLPRASTKRAILIGMLERAQGARGYRGHGHLPSPRNLHGYKHCSTGRSEAFEHGRGRRAGDPQSRNIPRG